MERRRAIGLATIVRERTGMYMVIRTLSRGRVAAFLPILITPHTAAFLCLSEECGKIRAACRAWGAIHRAPSCLVVDVLGRVVEDLARRRGGRGEVAGGGQARTGSAISRGGGGWDNDRRRRLEPQVAPLLRRGRRRGERDGGVRVVAHAELVDVEAFAEDDGAACAESLLEI